MTLLDSRPRNLGHTHFLHGMCQGTCRVIDTPGRWRGSAQKAARGG